MKNYIPYMGSKGKIAERVVDILPQSNVLVDLFAGGCAITQCASFAGKWQQIICNDMHAGAIELFRSCVAGAFDGPVPWVSREEFFQRVDDEQYIASVWSFGNRGREGGYMYSKELEPLKEAYHRHIYGDSRLYEENRAFFVDNPRFRLEHMERVQNLRNISVGKTPIEFSTLDYRHVCLPDDAVVYCDPPYKNTKRYNKKEFDWDEFIDWARLQTVPIYVSSYSCEGKEIAAFPKLSSVGKEKRKTIEKVFLVNGKEDF